MNNDKITIDIDSHKVISQLIQIICNKCQITPEQLEGLNNISQRVEKLEELAADQEFTDTVKDGEVLKALHCQADRGDKLKNDLAHYAEQLHKAQNSLDRIDRDSEDYEERLTNLEYHDLEDYDCSIRDHEDRLEELESKSGNASNELEDRVSSLERQLEDLLIALRSV